MSAQPPRPRSATVWFAAALLLFVVGSVVAWWQPPRLFPLKPQTTAEWWLQPLEDNAFQRMPRIAGDLNDVFVVPTTGEVWAVGDKGLIVHSRDQGRTWERAKTGFDSSSSTEQPDSSASNLSAERNYIEKTLIRLKQERQELVDNRTAEINGVSLPGTTGIKGYGKNAHQLSREISKIESQIAELESRLNYLLNKVDVNSEGRASPNLSAIYFIADGQYGWAVGAEGTILATKNGGKTWQEQTSGITEKLSDIVFDTDGLHGWAVGSRDTYLTTNNGGKTWQAQSGDLGGLSSITFTSNGQRGWAVGWDGTILATDNAGKTWQAQTSGTNEELRHILFIADGQRGWAVGSKGTILASDNGGKTWKAQTSGTDDDLYSMTFAADGQHGWAVARHGKILTSDNGGETWQSQSSDGGALASIAFAPDGQRGWAVGTNGTILASDNGGKTWHAQSSGGAGGLEGIALAADALHGWSAVSNGTILASDNGGKTWQAQASGTGENLEDIAFTADGQHGWAVGWYGRILSTENGGKTWQAQSSDSAAYLSNIALVADGQRGWAVGWDGEILATDNGGRTWQTQASGTKAQLLGVTFTADGQHGWVVGGGTILATDNGGKTWQAQGSGIRKHLYSILFATDSQRGWAVGANGTILTTDNGGKAWQEQTSGTTNWLMRVTFAADSQRGWVAGMHGTILTTDNGGKTWQTQTSGTHEDLRGVAFAADGQHGLAVGYNLTLLTTSNGGKTWTPVEYHRYPAPWYFLVCLLSLISASIGTLRPQPDFKAASVADVLASDRPLENTRDDALGYAEIAAGLSRFLRNPKTLPPLTLAITGEWGSGKSSLMNLVKADLRQAGFRTVWFNAWHHQKGEQLLASLFANLRAQAIPPWFSRTGWLFRWKLLARRSRRHALLLVGLLLLLSISLGYLAVDFQHFRQLLTAGDWAKLNKDSLAALSPLLGGVVVVLTALVALYNGMKGFGLDPAKLMASVSAGDSKLKPLEPGARYQFAEEFKDVTEALAPGRLVIFIDDLDRCSKENVLEVLESVNFLVSSGGCFVVLGMARAWVETCVGLSFKELAEEHNHDEADDKAYRVEFARKYLQKLINIEVPVPKLDAGASLRLMPDEQALPPPGNRLESMAAAAWGWLSEKRAVVMIMLLLAGGLGLGRGLAPQIGGELDSLGGKLHDSAQPPKPVELPLPAGLDVKLAGLEGGLDIALPSQAKSADGQLLLRADAKALDKGVVLGKLGGAELVLKRPAEIKPVEPLKPVVVEPAKKSDEPERKAPENNAPSFTPGASDDGHSPWHIGPPALTGLILLGFGLVLLLRSPVKLTEDSDQFMEALKTWHPLIAASCPTPRTVKRYLNWVRFLAMRYRLAEPEALGFGLRLARRLGLAAKPAEPAATAEKVFDEDILVALSAIYQYRREWVVDWRRFNRLKKDGPFQEQLTEALDAQQELATMEQAIKQTENVQEGFAKAIAEERLRMKTLERTAQHKLETEVFSNLTPEDWQRATNQRERFLTAIGDVDVA